MCSLQKGKQKPRAKVQRLHTVVMLWSNLVIPGACRLKGLSHSAVMKWAQQGLRSLPATPCPTCNSTHQNPPGYRCCLGPHPVLGHPQNIWASSVEGLRSKCGACRAPGWGTFVRCSDHKLVLHKSTNLDLVIIWTDKSSCYRDWYNLEMEGQKNGCLKTFWLVSWSDFQAFSFTRWHRSFYSFGSCQDLSMPSVSYAIFSSIFPIFSLVWGCAFSQHQGCFLIFSRAEQHMLWVQSSSFSLAAFLTAEQHLRISLSNKKKLK